MNVLVLSRLVCLFTRKLQIIGVGEMIVEGHVECEVQRW